MNDMRENMLEKICIFIANYPTLDLFFSRFKWYNQTHDSLLRLWEDEC